MPLKHPPRSTTTTENYGIHQPEDDDGVSVYSSSSSSSSSNHSALTLTETGNYTTSPRSTSGSSTTSSWSLARTETRMVLRSKLLVLAILAIATIVCGVSTYVYVKQSELHAFQQQFTDYATEIMDVSHIQAESMVRTIQAMSALITSTALLRTNNSTVFPNFVTMRHFDIHGMLNNQISKVLQLSYAPIVHHDQMAAWEAYVDTHRGWIDDDRPWQEHEDGTGDIVSQSVSTNISRQVHYLSSSSSSTTNKAHNITYNSKYNVSLPVWQQAPAPYRDPSHVINLDLLSHPVVARLFAGMAQKPVLSEAFSLEFLYGGSDAARDHHDDDDSDGKGSHPYSLILDPIHSIFRHYDDNTNHHRTTAAEQKELVGVLAAVVAWDSYFEHILHEGTSTIVLVLHNTCGDQQQYFTYMLDGPKAIYMGHGDLHDPKYSPYQLQTPFASFLRAAEHDESSASSSSSSSNMQQDYFGSCDYDLRIYPTAALEDHYRTNRPILYAWMVVMIFTMTVATFLVFDYAVALRQTKVMAKARRTHAIVSSLFPSHIRDQLIQDAEAEQQKLEQEKKAALKKKNKNNKKQLLLGRGSSTKQLQNFLGKDSSEKNFHATTTKPIAELFPQATIMFADIAGFTAWSSAREPCQVFVLLETLYQAFDEIAKRRRVFKVETIGDCYVAVGGVPDPRPDHAVVMARFATDCLEKVQILTKQLETTLGPDTGDLAVRFGLHSGPVTAGVLRGDKGRFQLFGDTVNTAARLESTGAPNRIHCSQETAMLLRDAGKDAWIRPRDDAVYAKGKGELQTYWIEIGSGRRRFSLLSSGAASRSSAGTGTDSAYSTTTEEVKDEKTVAAAANNNVKENVRTSSGDERRKCSSTKKNAVIKTLQENDNKQSRLIDWNTDILCRFLKKVVAFNNTTDNDNNNSGGDNGGGLPLSSSFDWNSRAIDEVVEIIELPELNTKATSYMSSSHEQVSLDDAVVDQVRSYVQAIAALYPNNPFHNFEHASHVAMSVSKLLSRIVEAPPSTDGSIHEGEDDGVGNDDDVVVKKLHEHTYGITSDPLTQFACVFTALIHDVDHAGVSNQQLVKENAPVACEYNGKSVAEQNSIHLAWELFMSNDYIDFRRALCRTDRDMQRFRQLVVNTVLATDIMDTDLKQLRNQRWTTAFHQDTTKDETTHPREQFNRKATIVLEHLIQASDIAHTMQHWSIYQKWNERLFVEMLQAYRTGRSDTNPADNWSRGEIGFFDFYVIPLAKKLKDCGAFGVSSDEYLSYAQQNRLEWERRGNDVVAQWVEKYCTVTTTHGSDDNNTAPTENTKSDDTTTVVPDSSVPLSIPQRHYGARQLDNSPSTVDYSQRVPLERLQSQSNMFYFL